MRIPIQVTERGGVARRQEPVELGLPFPRGKAPPDARWTVLDEKGDPLPSQFKPLVDYADGSRRAMHAVFLVDLKPRQTRSLAVVPGTSFAGPPLLARADGVFRMSPSGMEAEFDDAGALVSWRLGGTELLVKEGGPSLKLDVALGPAGEALSFAASPPAFTVAIKESGPVRAILNVHGRFALRDRRGGVSFLLDCDYACFAGKPEIHLGPMLLGAVTEASQIADWSLSLHLRNGKRVRYGSKPEQSRADPNHERMTWRALPHGWVSWTLENGAQLTAWSPDLARHQNGMISTDLLDEARRHLRVTLARVEPCWGYHDVSNPAKLIGINRGGWRRWEAVLGLHRAGQRPRDLVAGWRRPLRAFPSPGYYQECHRPRLEGITRRTPLRRRVAQKCREFVCREPEYAGSLHGGYDGINRTYLERGVARGEFGEYLFNEFFRSGETRFYEMAFDFGRVYRDIFCFTIPEAASGATTELGGARMRQSEHHACHIRSYRGAVLLAYMHQETGDERYQEALRQRAAFHLANYPNQIGRLSMSTRDTAFMGDYLHQPALTRKAVEVGLHSMDRHFDPKDGFYQDYQPVVAGETRSRPVAYPKGHWNVGEFLRSSNAKPEMTVYNIIGLYGLCRLHDPGDEFRQKLRRVCEWFRDVQNKDGSWSYPQHTSRTRWGHGCLQDAMGMVMAYNLFGDESYLEAARRSVRFAERLFRKHSRIPLIIGLSPFDQTEDSLVYYYGIEALALYEEALEKAEAA